MTFPALDVNITAELASVEVVHGGRRVTIMRNQDQNAAVNPEFAKTSRKCRRFVFSPASWRPA